jgi:Fe-S oxidoreductase
MLSLTGKLIFVLVILATAVAFLAPVVRRIRIITAGRPDRRFNRIGRRLASALSKILLQRCTLKSERVMTGFMHVFIFYSALTFDTMTINHTLEGFFPDFYLFGEGGFGLFFSLLVDLMAILVLIGVGFFAVRRFIIRPKAYQTTPLDSAVIYTALLLVTVSYMYFETFAIALHPATERLSFLGAALAHSAGNLPASVLSTHFQIGWWAHILLVFGFIAYVPHSKYFHMFAGSFNVLVNRDGPMGDLPAMDIENSEVFGVEKGSDYTWKDLLDAFACMECGRCQDACPAFNSDKPLSPKLIILNLKRHLLQNAALYQGGKREEIPALMEGTFSEGEIWTCTTCGACMNVCPVEIEHIRKLVGLRQSQVLMESKFPAELNTFFRNMETNSNPWGIGFADRFAWAEGLQVPLLSEKPDAEYLLWVGCAGSFDEEGRKITRSLVKVLQAAGVSFAALGAEEKCCGDSARRLGNEYLFQMQAAENITSFTTHHVRRIITLCPHGYNVFRHEYPRLLDILPDIPQESRELFRNLEVIHSSSLILQLMEEGRLRTQGNPDGRLTYHDSCYLGRHNGILEPPRRILNRLSAGEYVELKNNRRHSFCCGAGGGLMWTEENLGNRINHLRCDEVIASGAETVLTSCPFCQTMLKDGLKDKKRDEIRVLDLAQLVAERLEESE